MLSSMFYLLKFKNALSTDTYIIYGYVKKKKTETSSYPHNDLHNQKPGSIYTRTRSMLTICYHRFQHTPLREIIYSSSNVHNTTVYYSLTRESNKYVGKLDE